MVNIIKESSSFVIQGDVNSYPFKDGKISLPLNSLYFVIDESNVISFKQVNDNNTLLSVNINNLQINGEQVTKENLIEKFDAVANGNMGGSKINAGTNITLQPQEDGSITISATGELGGTVAWQDVTDKPSTFTPSAHNHVVADITDLQGKLDAKQNTLVSGTNIKTINGQDILGSGDIVIEGGTGDVTQAYVDEKLALKVDKTAYEADKATFALKTEIPSIEGLASKEELQNGLDGKQDKGDYALKSELPDISGLATKAELADKADASALATKQDTLVSGENVKTINGQTILGSGNIEIQGGGSGISDAPSDNKLYGRKNANWSEIIIPSTDNFATKSEIADMLTKTEASEKYQPKGEYLTEVPSEYVTETELSGKGYLTAIPEEYVTNEELTSALSSKQDKGDYITVETADGKYQVKGDYATKAELADKANTSDLSNYLQTSVAESTYAKKSEIPEEYTLPIATAEALGGIKVGAGLSINAETGVLSATGGGTADSVDWANITSKPETFTPSAHNHPISEVTDLQDKLDAKADTTAIADMATKTWVGEQGFLTSHQDISNLATKQEVTEGLAGKQDKGNYLTVETADGKYQVKGEYATTAQLANKVDVSTYTEDKATFALKSELTNLATKEELNLKANSSDLSNYVTTVNAEATYAKKSEIPSLEGYLQTSTADEKYATKTELSGKADTSAIADMLTKTEAASTYQPIGEYLTEVPAEYITESELDAKGYKKIEYLTQTQYDELQTKEEGVLYVITDAPEVVIPDTSTFATKEEIADMATKTWVGEQGYLTSIPDEYVTETELSGKGYATTSQLSGKQDTLVSGTNIKTINGESILGSGNIVIEGGSGSDVTKQYVDEQLDLKADKTSLNSYYTKSMSDEKYQPKGAYLRENNVTFTSSSIGEDDAKFNKIFIKTASTYAPSMDAPIQDDKDVYIGNNGILYQIYKKDTLTKTEASTTYALQSALQSALDRIAALEAQIGTLSTQLDNINGEVIN